jgi:hypothetical protein
MMDLTKGVGRYDINRFKEPSASEMAGAKMAGSFKGLGNAVMGAIAEPGLKREADAKTTKIQEYITKYNNPQDPDFAGMQGSQRALKLSRLLLPFDSQMSDDWSKRSFAMAQEEKASGMDLEKQKQKGLSDIELEKQKQLKPKEEKAIEASTPENLFRQAQSAIASGKYKLFYDSLNAKDQIVLPTPGTETRELIQSLLKKDVGAGETLANEIAQSGYKTTMDKEGAKQAPMETNVKSLQSGEALIGADQIKKEADGLFAGVPKTLESQVSNIKSEYLKLVAPLAAAINESSKLISMLGDGNSPIKGTRAIASVFGLMKSLDPTSTVRESEFDAVAGAQGAFGKFTNLAGQLESGLTLSADQAREMISLAGSWQTAAKLKMQNVKNQAEDLAKQLKIKESFVTGQSPAIGKKVFESTGSGKIKKGD